MAPELTELLVRSQKAREEASRLCRETAALLATLNSLPARRASSHARLDSRAFRPSQRRERLTSLVR
jgi:hypothetical protein